VVNKRLGNEVERVTSGLQEMTVGVQKITVGAISGVFVGRDGERFKGWKMAGATGSLERGI
jgi:hypothetical protein